MFKAFPSFTRGNAQKHNQKKERRNYISSIQKREYWRSWRNESQHDFYNCSTLIVIGFGGS